MNILLLAPHPFYQDRGTPIAVDMLLGALSAAGHQVDVCTFPEGEARDYPGVTLHRARPWGGTTNVGPGFSLKKLYTDVFVFIAARRLIRRNRYDVVHAIEEAGFMARYFAARYGLPYVYDMDSVLSDQLIASRPWMRPLRPLFESMEKRVVAGARVLAPMCQALADRFAANADTPVVLLRDVSLLSEDAVTAPDEDLRSELGIADPLAMYIGNLESYQGIDLLLRAFARARRTAPGSLVIIGGKPGHVERYRELAAELGVAGDVHLLGPRPVAKLGEYLRQADVLVSPRVRGANTPMKIYSYLSAGVVLLATDLPTHTQVMDSDIAELAAPEPEPFGCALSTLFRDAARRRDKAARAAQYARQAHSPASFRDSVQQLYREVARACPDSTG